MAGTHLGQAVLRSGSVAIPDELIHAILELLVEGNAVASERVGNRGECIVQLVRQVGADSSESAAGSGGEGRLGDVAYTVEDAAGNCESRRSLWRSVQAHPRHITDCVLTLLTDADKLLDNGARSSVEGVERSTFGGPALKVASVAVLADSKSVASLHALNGSNAVPAQARYYA